MANFNKVILAGNVTRDPELRYTAKGMAIGTVLAFMMAVTALSLPEAVILSKVLKKPLLATFFGIVATAIVIVGYLFNAIL